jgi:hypothetical protein
MDEEKAVEIPEEQPAEITCSGKVSVRMFIRMGIQEDQVES